MAKRGYLPSGEKRLFSLSPEGVMECVNFRVPNPNCGVYAFLKEDDSKVYIVGTGDKHCPFVGYHGW